MGFETDANRNNVHGVTGTPFSRSAMPKPGTIPPNLRVKFMNPSRENKY
jgi:hypothetical protein